MAKRRRKKSRPPSGGGSDSPRPVDFEIGDGAEAYIDAYGTSPTGMNFQGKAKISGNYVHRPGQDGRNRVVINRLVSGPGASKVEPTKAPPSSVRGRSSAGFTDLPGKVCSCGFTALDWQSVCPRCSRDLR